MTGLEHYAEAERLLNLHTEAGQDWAVQWGSQTLAAAQVHATLAHAAFGYYGGFQDPTDDEAAS